MDMLNLLRKQAVLCKQCGLHKTRTNVVFGDGNGEADLMFIGEAPGADEDEQGSPFVGKSGKLLRSTIEAVGISIPDVFITNTLMCRPPENRDPSPDEMASCHSWLDQKIAVINPSIIITVGRFSTARILGEDPSKMRITKMSGVPINTEGRVVIPLAHPAYVARGGMNKFQYVEHMAKVAIAAQQMGTRGI